MYLLKTAAMPIAVILISVTSCLQKDSTSAPAAAAAACTGDVASGSTTTRTKYSTETATRGLATCTSETQTGTCSDGTLTWTGTYTYDSCTLVPASITAGDILIVREPAGGADESTTTGGAIQVFSSSGSYKGVAAKRDAANDILRYPYGLEIEKHPTSSGMYYLLFGTTNASLQMEIHRFPELIDPTTSTTLTTPLQINNTDAVDNYYFSFGFSVNRNGGYRYLSDTDSGAPKIHFYFQGGSANGCSVNYGSGYAGQKIHAIGGRAYHIGKPVWVARANGSGYAIDSFSDCTDNGENPSPTFGVYTKAIDDVRVCSLFEMSYASGTWNNSVFVTHTTLLGSSPNTLRYPAGSGSGSGAFTNNAMAVHYPNISGGDQTLYTLEYDGSNRYIRTYNTSGVYQSTLYTDSTGVILPDTSSATCTWMTVVPSS